MLAHIIKITTNFKFDIQANNNKMIKKGVTPTQVLKQDQPPKQNIRRVFGKDLKNIITTYHNKLAQSNRSAKKHSLIQNPLQKKNKPTIRNNSQKIFKKSTVQALIKQDNQKNEPKKSITQSTQASPKSKTIKDYLKSRAPRAVSHISADIQINLKMRELVVSWLIQLVNKIPLKNQVLFHAILIFDYMLSKDRCSNLSEMIICIQNLQLLALACLFISAKYQEIYPPTADFMVKVADYTYSKKKIIEMEAQILLQQQFCLTFPTRYTFLQQSLNQILQQTNKSKRLQHMSLFLLQLSLLELWEQTTQQQIAQASIFLAKKIIGFDVQLPNQKICQIVWKLIKTWKNKRNSSICYIFDSDRFSFVGGIHLEQI